MADRVREVELSDMFRGNRMGLGRSDLQRVSVSVWREGGRKSPLSARLEGLDYKVRSRFIFLLRLSETNVVLHLLRLTASTPTSTAYFKPQTQPQPTSTRNSYSSHLSSLPGLYIPFLLSLPPPFSSLFHIRIPSHTPTKLKTRSKTHKRSFTVLVPALISESAGRLEAENT